MICEPIISAFSCSIISHISRAQVSIWVYSERGTLWGSQGRRTTGRCYWKIYSYVWTSVQDRHGIWPDTLRSSSGLCPSVAAAHTIFVYFTLSPSWSLLPSLFIVWEFHTCFLIESTAPILPLSLLHYSFPTPRVLFLSPLSSLSATCMFRGLWRLTGTCVASPGLNLWRKLTPTHPPTPEATICNNCTLGLGRDFKSPLPSRLGAELS